MKHSFFIAVMCFSVLATSFCSVVSDWKVCSEEWWPSSYTEEHVQPLHGVLGAEYQISSTRSFSIMECDGQCQNVDTCLSYSYGRRTSECILFLTELTTESIDMGGYILQSRNHYQRSRKLMCDMNTCQNGGLCISHCHGNGYTCNCTDGFYGKHCSDRDGGWTEWTGWTVCVLPPGTPAWQCVATRERIRECSNPTVEGAGSDCVGENKLTKLCIPASSICPESCADIQNLGATDSGVYGVRTTETGNFKVYCDLETGTGGWIVLQRRYDGSVNFNVSFEAYVVGFGSLEGELWLGNNYISALSRNLGTTQLLIELEDWDMNTRYVLYEEFYVEAITNNFHFNNPLVKVDSDIAIDDDSIDDPFVSHVSGDFSTYLDPGAPTCASNYCGGWWFISSPGSDCAYTNLNGKYYNLDEGDTVVPGTGIFWTTWHNSSYSLKATQMKLRSKP